MLPLSCQSGSGILDTLPVSLLQWDLQGVIQYVNPIAEQTLGSVKGTLACDLHEPVSLLVPTSAESIAAIVGEKPACVLPSFSLPCLLPERKRHTFTFFVGWDGSGLLTAVLQEEAINLHPALREIALSLVNNQPLSDVLCIISSHARILCGADRSYVKLYDRASKLLEFRAISSADGRDRLPSQGTPSDRGATGFVYTTRKPFRSPDVSREPKGRYFALFPDTVSKLVVPVLFEEGPESTRSPCLGVLCVDGRRPDQFDDWHEQVLVTLAHHISLAILQAELREAHEAYLALMSDRESSVIHLAAGLLHDAKNVMVTIRYHLGELLDNLSARRSMSQAIADLQHVRERVVDTQFTLGEIANHLNHALKGDQTKLHAEYVDVHRIVKRIVNLLPLHEQDVEVEVVIEPPASNWQVFIHPTKLFLVLYNVLNNALNALRDEGPKGQIDIGIGPTPNKAGSCRIEIADNGLGIPAPVLRRIQADEPTTTLARSGGLGLGLRVVKKNIAEANGVVDIRSRFGSGTTIIIDIPGKLD